MLTPERLAEIRAIQAADAASQEAFRRRYPEDDSIPNWHMARYREDVPALLAEVDRLRAELAEARARCEGLAERVAAQSELLSRRAEKG